MYYALYSPACNMRPGDNQFNSQQIATRVVWLRWCVVRRRCSRDLLAAAAAQIRSSYYQHCDLLQMQQRNLLSGENIGVEAPGGKRMQQLFAICGEITAQFVHALRC